MSKNFFRFFLGAIRFVALVSFAFASRADAFVELSSPSTTLRVNGGEANDGATSFDGYFRYTDLAANEETSWSIDPLFIAANGSVRNLADGSNGGFGSPVDLMNGTARSTATVGNVSIQADTTLVGNIARTTFTVTSSGSLSGAVLVFHAENDIDSSGDDAASFSGSIGSNNLVIRQSETSAGGLTVSLSATPGSNSAISSFGSGIFSGFGAALESGNLAVLSNSGSNFVSGPGDLGSAIALSLNGSSASFVVDYSTSGFSGAGGTKAAPAMSSFGLVVLFIGLTLAGVLAVRRSGAGVPRSRC